MQENTPLALGADIGLGEPSDRPISKWQEMFLPQKLHDWVATKQIRDSTGAMHPLALNDRVLVSSTRGSGSDDRAGVLLALARRRSARRRCSSRSASRRERRARRASRASIVMSVWAAVCGILGLLVARAGVHRSPIRPSE